MNSRSVFLGFPLTMILEPDGTVVERIEPKKSRESDRLRPEDLRRPIPRRRSAFFARGQHFSLRPETGLPWWAHSVRCAALSIRGVDFPPVAEAGVALYGALEQKKAGIQIAFASMFALIALIVLLSAIWFGLNFANRLVAPIRRLIHATDQVATGNFYVQVPVRRGEGDLAHLGETFNKMTSELRHQHDGLTAASDLMDRRRRFTEAVLAGVSAGVIGINAQGVITIVNPSTEALLTTSADNLIGAPITTCFRKLRALSRKCARDGTA